MVQTLINQLYTIDILVSSDSCTLIHQPTFKRRHIQTQVQPTQLKVDPIFFLLKYFVLQKENMFLLTIQFCLVIHFKASFSKRELPFFSNATSNAWAFVGLNEHNHFLSFLHKGRNTMQTCCQQANTIWGVFESMLYLWLVFRRHVNPISQLGSRTPCWHTKLQWECCYCSLLSHSVLEAYGSFSDAMLAHFHYCLHRRHVGTHNMKSLII